MAEPTIYGVWIDGQGWLKRFEDGKDKPLVFAALDRHVAETAVTLWGQGAQLLPFDKSLVEFETQLLERQAQKAPKGWRAWVTSIRSQRLR